MATIEDIESRQVALEQLVLKHLVEIRAKLFPDDTPGLSDPLAGMHGIYTHHMSAQRGAKVPDVKPDPKLESFAGIYKKGASK